MDTKEERIRKITSMYYSRPEIQQAIFDFSKNREISSRFFEAFGKRPDSFQYKGDIFELVKKGATSFHCSVELWSDPLKLSTNQTKEQLSELRTGWDLLIDIDCKYFDFSKKAAQAVVEVLRDYGVKNIGLKFSGSKGFHILVPWNSFPKVIAGENTKDLFPELPRKLIQFIRFHAPEKLRPLLPNDFYEQFKNTKIKKGRTCVNCNEIAKELKLVTYNCPNKSCKAEYTKKISPENLQKELEKISLCQNKKCNSPLKINDNAIKDLYECKICNISSNKNPENFSSYEEIDLFDLMGLDMILISPRHLFRMPYSLHEKTSLASVVIDKNELPNFQPMDADPFKIKIKNFSPEAKEGEATQLVIQALEWYRAANPEKETENKTPKSFEPVKIENISEKIFPPSIQQILKGVSDGRKRALFILLNLFRSIGMEKDQIEKEINDWNKKNPTQLDDGYIRAQIMWSYRNKIIPPPNFDKEYYKGIGIIPTEEELRYKNPLNYIVKKSFSKSGKQKR